MSTVETTWRCASCGHGACRRYPRVANVAGIAWFLGLAAMVYGLTVGSWLWMGVSLPALLLSPLGHVLGGVWWWGGVRCARCGHVEMQR